MRHIFIILTLITLSYSQYLCGINPNTANPSIIQLNVENNIIKGNILTIANGEAFLINAPLLLITFKNGTVEKVKIIYSSNEGEIKVKNVSSAYVIFLGYGNNYEYDCIAKNYLSTIKGFKEWYESTYSKPFENLSLSDFGQLNYDLMYLSNGENIERFELLPSASLQVVEKKREIEITQLPPELCLPLAALFGIALASFFARGINPFFWMGLNVSLIRRGFDYTQLFRRRTKARGLLSRAEKIEKRLSTISSALTEAEKELGKLEQGRMDKNNKNQQNVKNDTNQQNVKNNINQQNVKETDNNKPKTQKSTNTIKTHVIKTVGKLIKPLKLVKKAHEVYKKPTEMAKHLTEEMIDVVEKPIETLEIQAYKKAQTKKGLKAKLLKVSSFTSSIIRKLLPYAIMLTTNPKGLTLIPQPSSIIAYTLHRSKQEIQQKIEEINMKSTTYDNISYITTNNYDSIINNPNISEDEKKKIEKLKELEQKKEELEDDIQKLTSAKEGEIKAKKELEKVNKEIYETVGNMKPTTLFTIIETYIKQNEVKQNEVQGEENKTIKEQYNELKQYYDDAKKYKTVDKLFEKRPDIMGIIFTMLSITTLLSFTMQNAQQPSSKPQQDTAQQNNTQNQNEEQPSTSSEPKQPTNKTERNKSKGNQQSQQTSSQQTQQQTPQQKENDNKPKENHQETDSSSPSETNNP